MSKVVKSDLTSVNKSLSSYSSISSDTTNLINQIKSFVTSSTTILKGDAYDALRNRLNMYVDAYEKQQTILDNMLNNFTAVNNSMANYMEEYNSLDDVYIDQIKNDIKNAKEKLAYFESMLNNSRLTESNKQQIRNAITTLKQEITRLEKLLAKLEGLKPKDNELNSQISSTKNDIDTFETAVNKINPIKYTS